MPASCRSGCTRKLPQNIGRDGNRTFQIWAVDQKGKKKMGGREQIATALLELSNRTRALRQINNNPKNNNYLLNTYHVAGSIYTHYPI